MKLGFLSACMPERSLEEVARWAGAHGYVLKSATSEEIVAAAKLLADR